MIVSVVWSELESLRDHEFLFHPIPTNFFLEVSFGLFAFFPALSECRQQFLLPSGWLGFSLALSGSVLATAGAILGWHGWSRTELNFIQC